MIAQFRVYMDSIEIGAKDQEGILYDRNLNVINWKMLLLDVYF
jgi:hypothetical protein